MVTFCIFINMFILAQLSIFDLRLLQVPESLLYLRRVWPWVNDGQMFVNHFGLAKENMDDLLVDHLLSEDRVFIECKHSLKFETLNIASDPCKVTCKQRRLYFDNSGGARLVIGLMVHLSRYNPFKSVNEAIHFALQKKLRIHSPHKKTQTVQLIHLTPSFKNLYAYSVSQPDTYSQYKHLVRAHKPLLWVHLSQQEWKDFQPLKGYRSVEVNQDSHLLYNRNVFSNRPFDTYLTSPVSDSPIKRHQTYFLFKLNTLEQNLRSLIHFHKSIPTLSSHAMAEQQLLFQKLFEDRLTAEWQDVYQAYKQTAPRRLRTLEKLWSGSDILEKNVWEPHHWNPTKENILYLVAKGHLGDALRLAESFFRNADPEILQTLVILQARYQSVIQKEQRKTAPSEEINVEKNRIRQALMELVEEKEA